MYDSRREALGVIGSSMTIQTNDHVSNDDSSTTFAPAPRQQEIPLAVVRGEPMLQIPQDLYIPPDALEVILDAFEGPLDLLLYLIRRQNLDILDIPIAEITRQYVDYIEMMQDLKLELAAEYLVMAAILAEIKSRLLLPRPPEVEGLEEDPRAELVRRRNTNASRGPPRTSTRCLAWIAIWPGRARSSPIATSSACRRRWSFASSCSRSRT